MIEYGDTVCFSAAPSSDHPELYTCIVQILQVCVASVVENHCEIITLHAANRHFEEPNYDLSWIIVVTFDREREEI